MNTNFKKFIHNMYKPIGIGKSFWWCVVASCLKWQSWLGISIPKFNIKNPPLNQQLPQITNRRK